MTTDAPKPPPTRLQEARLAAGLSTRDVAKQLAAELRVSHATIANYEKGRSSPSMPVLTALAEIYCKPVIWFLRSGPELIGKRYRYRKSKLRQSEMKWFEANVARWIEAYARLEGHLGVKLDGVIAWRPEPNQSGRMLAELVRAELGVKEDDPITSVVDVLELFGVRVIELPTDLPIDGMAAVYDSEFAVVINPMVSNDRCRLNGGHELGHIAAGDCETEDESETKESEKRAFEFASHFLLPDKPLRDAFRGQSMVRLLKFKERFGISLAGMLYRAHESGIIKLSEYKWLLIEFGKRGWRTREPGYVRADRATRFEQILDSAIALGELSWAEAAHVTGVREEELRERVRLALGGSEIEEEGGEDDENVLKFPH